MDFVLGVEQAGIHHRYIQPERTCDVDRFSLALHGETPAEKLARRLPDAKIA